LKTIPVGFRANSFASFALRSPPRRERRGDHAVG
jgi:hypothetical protein